MDGASKRVLIIASELATLSHAVPCFKRSHISLNTVNDGASAIEMTSDDAYALIIIQLPLPDLSLGRFLEAIEANNRDHQRAATLVLARQEDSDEVRKSLGNKVDRLVNLDWINSEIQPAIAGLLKLQVRRDVRFSLSLEVALYSDGRRLSCSIVDPSRSGMQVHSEHGVNMGKRVRFELKLSDDEPAICGEAEAVRLIKNEDGAVAGFGAKFVSFYGDSRRQLARSLMTRPVSA
jgi:CheY-like chemotaxis protein